MYTHLEPAHDGVEGSDDSEQEEDAEVGKPCQSFEGDARRIEHGRREQDQTQNEEGRTQLSQNSGIVTELQILKAVEKRLVQFLRIQRSNFKQ